MNPADFPDWLKPPISSKPTPGASDALSRAMTASLQVPTTSIPEKSLVQKLQDTVTFGRKYLETNKKPARDILAQKITEPGKSRPLTDKFEEEAQTCSFAFALFTPDDEVFNSTETYNQARPNVTYETGWFIGRLGRQRVILVLKDGTKIHSDLHGVSQVRFINTVEEKFREIQQELRAARIIV